MGATLLIVAQSALKAEAAGVLDSDAPASTTRVRLSCTTRGCTFGGRAVQQRCGPAPSQGCAGTPRPGDIATANFNHYFSLSRLTADAENDDLYDSAMDIEVSQKLKGAVQVMRL